MALKRKITKAEHEALSADLKSEYKAEGAGFVLDVDGGDELVAAKEAEKEARKAAEKALKKAQEDLAALEDKTNRANGDVAALDASYKKKVADLEAAVAAGDKRVQDTLRAQHVTAQAARIAKRFTVPSLLEPQIAGRLSVEMNGDEAIVRVLDKAGKPSALSVADLEKEFVDNPEFKSIVIASKANGGGAPNGLNGGGAPNFPNFNPSGQQPVSLAKMTPKEMAADFKQRMENEG